MDGIINVYKEKGYTSHDVVAIVRKMCGRIKCGHTGTLDPDAEGVLPLCLGKATKLSSYVMDGYKRYEAHLKLGITTTTQDAAGEILEIKPVSASPEDIEEAAKSFLGEYMQTPPMYSAVKVNGKKLYELARKGEEIERKKRKVFIYSIDVSDYNYPDECLLDVKCSKGTYIRTLCADIGEALGCGGHMASLLRTETSGFHIKDSIKLDELKILAEEGRISEVLIPMEKILEDYKRVCVRPEAEKILLNGGTVYEDFFETSDEPEIGEEITVYYGGNKLAGIYRFGFDSEKGKKFVIPVKMLI